MELTQPALAAHQPTLVKRDNTIFNSTERERERERDSRVSAETAAAYGTVRQLADYHSRNVTAVHNQFTFMSHCHGNVLFTGSHSFIHSFSRSIYTVLYVSLCHTEQAVYNAADTDNQHGCSHQRAFTPFNQTRTDPLIYDSHFVKYIFLFSTMRVQNVVSTSLQDHRCCIEFTVLQGHPENSRRSLSTDVSASKLNRALK